jgi:hypothetical protein
VTTREAVVRVRPAPGVFLLVRPLLRLRVTLTDGDDTTSLKLEGSLADWMSNDELPLSSLCLEPVVEPCGHSVYRVDGWTVADCVLV